MKAFIYFHCALYGLFVLAAACAAYRQAWSRWFRLKRVCAWCRCRMGGNPLAGKVTHGVCAKCFEEQVGRPPNRPRK